MYGGQYTLCHRTQSTTVQFYDVLACEVVRTGKYQDQHQIKRISLLVTVVIVVVADGTLQSSLAHHPGLWKLWQFDNRFASII